MRCLDSTCWGKLELCWKGPLNFCIEEISDIPPALSGVYVLGAFTPTWPLIIPYYAGQSAQLRRRLMEHFGGTGTLARHLRVRLSTYFCVAAVSNPLLRSAAEAALIRDFRPAGNSMFPAPPPILVTPPPNSLLVD